MKKVTNTWKEPIIIHLSKKVPGKSTPDMSVRQLLVGESVDIKDSQLSPGLELMKRKGRVEIKDLEPDEPEAQVERAPEVKEPLPKDELLDEDEVKKLETELLQSEPDPMEG